jgi:hypothetical protein
MPPTPFVPEVLLSGPFHRRHALAAGLTDEQLRSKCWTRLFREVYVHRSIDLTDPQRFEALRLVAPARAVATGLTAAWLYGIWTPRPGASVPLHLATSRGRAAFTAPGVRSSRFVVDLGDVDELHGVPVTTPVRACFGLMRAASLTEAVVWGDAFLHAGLICSGGLARYADERPRWPGVRRVREAAALARAGAASPMESRLRMVIVLGGLPEPPLLNAPVYDAWNNLLGVPDMRYLIPRFGLEYDGAHHAGCEQHLADLTRENRLLLGDMPLLRYSARDVFELPHKICREVDAMLRGRR